MAINQSRLGQGRPNQGRMNQGRLHTHPKTRTAPRRGLASQATTIMKAMGNRQRLEILSHLMNGEERSVSELERTLKTISQSSLSQHLGRLRAADIVKTRRDSQMIYYSLSDTGVRQMLELLSNLYTDDPALPNKSRKVK